MLNKKALAASVSAPPAIYPEDVFSTFLYTGTGATQTITNNIDLSGKGGLTWIKGRSGATGHRLTDTVRGATKSLASNSTDAEATESTGLTAFGSTGFTIGADADYNTSAATYCSWTFREQAKFFDIVTYTATGGTQNVSHSLGSVPGFVIIKRTDASQGWQIAARRADGNYALLDFTTAAQSGFTTPGTLGLTSTTFDANAMVSTSAGQTYVAYLFAHDAGGFGAAGTDNVISCGSFTTNASGQATVTLGYEPQYILAKKSSGGGGDWMIFDVMRGTSYTDASILYANSSGTGINLAYSAINLTATGFNTVDWFDGTSTYIYMAIRRPMKPPTSGTSVYKSSLLAGNSSTQQITDLSFAPDLVMTKARDVTFGNRWTDRLRGFGRALRSDDVGAELDNTTDGVNPFNMNGYTLLGGNPYNASGFNYVNHAFRRATGFMDVVCFTGSSVTQTIPHNLGVVPELMIVKSRNTATNWDVLSNFTASDFKDTLLNLSNSSNTLSYGPGGSPNFEIMTAQPSNTSFFVSSSAQLNFSGRTFVAYLFATLAGVSKVGSYTGTAATQTINCGFTAGARFVLIKRTDSTGDWYVWDTARGIASGNDPYLLLNTTDAEVTSTDYIDPVSSGFEISSTAPAAINANGGSFIFMAIA